ncbi:MAG: hypothetical protein U5N56_05115 [Candidatus Marinimicrobia bacterium]|nr:hypothetical protein [Candidatus Neomarinimicrobiota bacterium]
MKKFMIFLLAVFFLFSCSSFIYYPNGVRHSLIERKKEMQFSAAVKGLGVDLRSAFALSDHVGFQLNANAVNITNTELGTRYWNGNYYGEVAVGIFTSLRPWLVIEGYLGTGSGISYSKDLDINSLRTTNYNKLYLQQDIGLRTRYIDFGFALREAFVDAWKTRIDGIDQEERAMDMFIEPLVFLAVGFEKFKINAQAGLSYSQFNGINMYAPFIFSVGLESRLFKR